MEKQSITLKNRDGSATTLWIDYEAWQMEVRFMKAREELAFCSGFGRYKWTKEEEAEVMKRHGLEETESGYKLIDLPNTEGDEKG